MKELSIEEKAKAYDKAIEKIREGIQPLQDGSKISGVTKDFLEEVFPELAESEDERIKKWLIGYFHQYKEDGMERYANGLKVDDILAWLEKQGKYQIHYWTEEEIEPIISDYLRGAEHYGGMIARLRCLKPKSLEKQGENKKEINNFDVLPGLYKCVHRMFDGTPDGRLLFEVGNVYKCLSKHDRAEFEVSYGHSIYLEDPVVCKHFIPFEKQDEVESDNDDIEVEEKGIREAFNKIEDEKQDKQKSQRMISAEAKEAMYNKPTWSEEDEYMLESIVSDFAAGHKSSIGQDKWLKSLKDRCDWKPSDEQMADLWNMLCECRPADHQLLQDIYYGLKKLREE